MQDHVIEGLCEFMEGGSWLYILNLPSFIGTDIVVVDIWY